jgi:hypothetical protein
VQEVINEGEIMMERTPKELIDWVESKIDTIDEKTLRLHQGFAKQLVEEVYPLAIFAFKKYGETQLIHIKPTIGNQNYDAILTDDSCSPTLKKYIEITQSHEGETAYLRAIYLQEHGYAPLTGTIKKKGTKKTGLRVTAQLEAVSAVEAAEREIQRVVDAILRKESKSYPPNTCLVVMFDDGYMIRRIINNTIIDRVIQDKILGRDLYFDEVYIVGKYKVVFRQYQLVNNGRQITRVVIK